MLALGATVCAVIFMIANQPPPAAKVVKREAPSRPLAYEQAISGTQTPGENEPDAAAKAETKAPAPKTETAAPAKTPDATESPAIPDLPETAQPAPATQAEPRVAAVPQQAPADPYAAQPPMQSVPQNHQTWAPPDEGMSNESQGADQWGSQGEGQWGNDQGYDPNYDQGYDQGTGGYDRPDDQWGDQGYDQGQDQGYDQGNNQWANAPPRDRWGNPAPDQWGNQPPPPGQWTPPGAQPGQPVPPGQWSQPGQPAQPGQWADQNTETGEQWVQVVLSGAEMRASASDTAPSLFSFPYGRSLKVVSFQEGWAEVIDPQSAATGWMKMQYLAPAQAPRPPGYEQQYDAYYQEPPRERRGLFRGGFADMINRAFGGGN